MARDYEYIDSVACYGEIGNNVFDRLAESRREVWFGEDGSGLIRSQHVRSRFFTDEQQLRWERLPTPAAREATGPSLDLFAAGCFHGPRRELARLPSDRAELEGYLQSRRQLTLNAFHQLIGEALVPSGQRQLLLIWPPVSRAPGSLTAPLINSVAQGSASAALNVISVGTRL
jgi:hypothetical protein